MDRDYNFALNHLQNGLQLLQLPLPLQRREVAPVETAKAKEVAEAGKGREEG
jgi:hypothetical protein